MGTKTISYCGENRKQNIMECKKETNSQMCTCTYSSCSRHGVCCDCLVYHLKKRQLPGCVFPKDAEATYDRSFEHFARLVQEKNV